MKKCELGRPQYYNNSGNTSYRHLFEEKHLFGEILANEKTVSTVKINNAWCNESLLTSLLYIFCLKLLRPENLVAAMT